MDRYVNDGLPFEQVQVEFLPVLTAHTISVQDAGKRCSA